MMKKRFIAGAVCPSCKQIDKLVIYRVDDETYRECVHCGFKESQSASLVQEELPTRVNQEPIKQDNVDVVKFVPSKNKTNLDPH